MTHNRPKLRLAFTLFFWRALLILVVGGEVVLMVTIWHRIGPGIPILDQLVIFTLISVAFVVMPAFSLACLMAIVADLLVMLVVDPVVRNWHSPRSDSSRLAFHLSAGESILATSPARRPGTRRGGVGSLVLTDRRLWFIPAAWDREPWSTDLASVWSIRLVPSPRICFGLIRGWPKRIAVDTGPPRPIPLVVPDPETVSEWAHLTQRGRPVLSRSS